MQLDEREFGRPVDGDTPVEFTLLCSDFGDVDVEVAGQVAFEPGTLGLLVIRVRQPRDAVALQATMQGRPCQLRDRRLKRVDALLQRKESVTSERHDDGFVLARQHLRFRFARSYLAILG